MTDLLNFKVYFLESTAINFLLFFLSDVVRNLYKFKCGGTHLHMMDDSCHSLLV
jgi:hypothetical protein